MDRLNLSKILNPWSPLRVSPQPGDKLPKGHSCGHKINYHIWMFCISFLLLASEIIFFKIFSFVGLHYFDSLAVISLAFLGIGFGGIIAFWLMKQKFILNYLPFLFFCLVLFAFFRVIGFFQFIPKEVFVFMPFAAASVGIAILYVRLKPGKAYLANATGSALGILGGIVALDSIGAENALLVILLSSLILSWGGSHSNNKKYRLLLLALIFMFCSVLSFNLEFDFLNTAKIFRGYSPPDYYKIFKFLKYPDRNKLLYSRWSSLSRIDVLENKNSETIQLFGDGYQWGPVTNSSCWILLAPSEPPYYLYNQPEVLVMGPAGGRALAVARGGGASRIVGVEINPAIVRLMKNELSAYSDNLYNTTEIIEGDGRAYIEKTSDRFDIIVFMGAVQLTHTHSTAIPYFLYTKEAFVQYLEHLRPQGMLFIAFPEEAHPQLLATIFASLSQMGIRHPEKHTMIFEFKHELLAASRKPATHGYTTKIYIVKKEPIEPEEELQIIKNITDPRWNRYNSTLLFSPHSNHNQITNFITSEHPVLTDNRPFFTIPCWLFGDLGRLKKLLVAMLLCVLLFIMLPAIMLTARFKQPGKAPQERRLIKGLAWKITAIFSLLGVGYIMLELIMVQKFQIFLESPTRSFAFVAAAILAFSGFGGYISTKLKSRGLFSLFVLFIIFLLLVIFGMEDILLGLIKKTILFKMIFNAVIIIPISFFLGVLFTRSLNCLKKLHMDRLVTLAWAVDSGFSVVGALLAIIISVRWGFKLALLVGLGCYFCAFILYQSLETTVTNTGS